MKTRLVATTLLTVCAVAQAAPPVEPAGSPDKDQVPPPEKKMKAAEPMKTPMARDGTMMGDVRESAMKKDAAMQEMMKQEEMKPPAAPK